MIFDVKILLDCATYCYVVLLSRNLAPSFLVSLSLRKWDDGTLNEKLELSDFTVHSSPCLTTFKKKNISRVLGFAPYFHFLVPKIEIH
jgi:hypothetical protein